MSSASQKSETDGRILGRKGRERRRLILEAAKQRIIDKGLDGLVLRDDDARIFGQRHDS